MIAALAQTGLSEWSLLAIIGALWMVVTAIIGFLFRSLSNKLNEVAASMHALDIKIAGVFAGKADREQIETLRSEISAVRERLTAVEVRIGRAGGAAQ